MYYSALWQSFDKWNIDCSINLDQFLIGSWKLDVCEIGFYPALFCHIQVLYVLIPIYSIPCCICFDNCMCCFVRYLLLWPFFVDSHIYQFHCLSILILYKEYKEPWCISLSILTQGPLCNEPGPIDHLITALIFYWVNHRGSSIISMHQHLISYSI